MNASLRVASTSLNPPDRLAHLMRERPAVFLIFHIIPENRTTYIFPSRTCFAISRGVRSRRPWRTKTRRNVRAAKQYLACRDTKHIDHHFQIPRDVIVQKPSIVLAGAAVKLRLNKVNVSEAKVGNELHIELIRAIDFKRARAGGYDEIAAVVGPETATCGRHHRRRPLHRPMLQVPVDALKATRIDERDDGTDELPDMGQIQQHQTAVFPRADQKHDGAPRGL